MPRSNELQLFVLLFKERIDNERKLQGAIYEKYRPGLDKALLILNDCLNDMEKKVA